MVVSHSRVWYEIAELIGLQHRKTCARVLVHIRFSKLSNSLHLQIPICHYLCMAESKFCVCVSFSKILICSLVCVLVSTEGLAVGVGFGAIGKTPSATFESAR